MLRAAWPKLWVGLAACTHTHQPGKKEAGTYQKITAKKEFCLSKLNKNNYLGLIKSPLPWKAHFLSVFCSPEPERGLDWLFTRVKSELHLPLSDRDYSILTEDVFLSAAPWQWFWFSQQIQAHQRVPSLLRWTWSGGQSQSRGAAPAPAAFPESGSGPSALSVRNKKPAQNQGGVLGCEVTLWCPLSTAVKIRHSKSNTSSAGK